MLKFWIDCVLATIFVFAVLWGLFRLTELSVLNALDPISQALEDVELTDYAFSKLRIAEPPIDTNIVIVNTGYLSRAEIGQQIRVLSQFNPKLFALDIIFSCDGGLTDSINCPQRYDTLGNLLFADAIANAGTVVMANKLWQSSRALKASNKDDAAVYDSLEHTDEDLRLNSLEGFVNLPTGAEHQEDLKVCRSVIPAIQVGNKTELAFAVKVAQAYDSVVTNRFLSRGKEEEIINYRGNIVDWHGASTYPGRYIVLDWDQALDPSKFTPGLIKDKIILMGFLGGDLRDTSWDDKFFTPLNKIFAGRARPDMYGVVVHANIISMILESDYIDELMQWEQIAIAIIICFLNVALFSFIFKTIPIWFDTVTVGLQLVQLLLFAVLVPYIFYWFNFKLEITLALATLALAGPCFEIYISIIKAGAKYFKKRIRLTKQRKKVLT
ncbi:MAG TPA: CHASE2 domain-containing protein [Ohtaekwangia sp.]|nr:CHASE2 domain-containing protein [Ohtaekwangia sp.]